MQRLKILIIEDDAISAYHLSEILVDIGYLVTDIASDYDGGLLAFKKNLPDLVLIDINLGEESKDGIELAKSLNALKQNIPLVFISGNHDKAFRDRAYETAHADFLVKPYNKNQIELSVERALLNFNQKSNSSELLSGDNRVFIKVKGIFVKVDIADILGIDADGGMSHIHTHDSKGTVSTNLENLLEQINSNQLIRIHRSHAINLEKITALNYSEGQVTVGSEDKVMKFNIGPKYKEDLSGRIKTIKSS